METANWQDELRRLDAQLADGELTRQQYAAKRDELLAQASSVAGARPTARPTAPQSNSDDSDGDDPQPPAAAQDGAPSATGPEASDTADAGADDPTADAGADDPGTEADAEDPGADAAAEPQHAGTARPAEPDAPAANSRQAPPRPPAADLLTTSRQTSAPSPADDAPTDTLPVVPAAAADAAAGDAATRTPAAVAVAAGAATTAAGSGRTTAAPPATEPAAAATGADADAAAAGRKPEVRQSTEHPIPVAPLPQYRSSRRTEPDTAEEPEPEPSTTTRGTRPTTAFLVLGVLVACAVIAGGVWWISGGSADTDQAADAAGSAPVQDAGPDAEMIDRLPRLPGVVNGDSDTFSVDEGVDRELYGADEALILRESGVETVTWKGSSRQSGDGAFAYVVLVAENESADDAESTTKELTTFGRQHASPGDPVDGHEDLTTLSRIDDEASTYRAVYTSAEYTVRVGVVQQPGGSEQEVSGQLATVLDDVTEVLPPDDE